MTSIFAGNICNQQVDGGVYKGALYENITAGIIAKGAAAVEVKSATNRKAKSMKSLVENYSMQHGFKLGLSNMGDPGRVETIPIYLAKII